MMALVDALEKDGLTYILEIKYGLAEDEYNIKVHTL